VGGTNALQGSETTRFARQNDQKWATKRESADCNAIFQQPARALFSCLLIPPAHGPEIAVTSAGAKDTVPVAPFAQKKTSEI
jgi:hypothetical protein